MRELSVVSVVIPTHNRSRSLKRTLDALSEQTYPLDAMEVLVVADGCTDDTHELLRCYNPPYILRIVEQPAAGPAVARNRGAALATGHLFVFIDDDIEATPQLIEAHVRALRQCPRHAVIGYMPPFLEEQTGFFRLSLRSWLENKFGMMSRSGHRYTFRDLLSGNFSIEAGLFAAIGGFDPGLYCHEDYELGIRLIKAGVSLIFAPNALGYHHDATQLRGSLKRKYDEGRADVLIGHRHPKIRAVLPLSRAGSWSHLNYIFRKIAFVWPSCDHFVTAGVQCALVVMERLRMRRLWRRLLDNLLDFWYWRGVATELRTRQALIDYLQSVKALTDGGAPDFEIDLAHGLIAAERRLDAQRPASASIRYGAQLVGRIFPQAGAEPLRGAHLRRILATTMAPPLRDVLKSENAATRTTLPSSSPFA